MNNNFYQFRAEGDEPTQAELMIFAAIGDWEELGEVSAKAFSGDLAKLPTSVKRLDIHINSPGGSVFEAQAIYSRLADHKSTKHVYVDGLAASAASIIAMVGHKIFIRANANMMVHLPSGISMGNADDMRHMATALDSITESMINVYAKRTKLPRDEIRSLMAEETWFSPQDAIDKGFADEIRGVVKAAAIVGNGHVVINGVEHDLSRFHNVPAFTALTPSNRSTMKPKQKVTAAAGGATADPDDDNGNGDGNENPTPPTTTPPQTAPKPEPPEPPKPPPAAATAETDFDKGMAAERQRVTALQELDRPATHDIVQAAIKDGKQPADIFKDCIEAMDKASKQGARRADASVLNHIPPTNGADDDKSFGSLITQKVKARMKGRRVTASRN